MHEAKSKKLISEEEKRFYQSVQRSKYTCVLLPFKNRLVKVYLSKGKKIVDADGKVVDNVMLEEGGADIKVFVPYRSDVVAAGLPKGYLVIEEVGQK